MNLNYITRREMACKCGCGKDTFDVELSGVLEDLRKHFRQRVFVLSGNRCEEYNAQVGGAKLSQHVLSKAADVKIEKVEPIKVYTYLANKYMTKYGVGSYETFTHIDVRPDKARW